MASWEDPVPAAVTITEVSDGAGAATDFYSLAPGETAEIEVERKDGGSELWLYGVQWSIDGTVAQVTSRILPASRSLAAGPHSLGPVNADNHGQHFRIFVQNKDGSPSESVSADVRVKKNQFHK